MHQGRRAIRHAIRRRAILHTAIMLCSDMPGYARLPGCSDMPGCPVCPAPTLGDASGPTSRLSRAAERAVMKRYGNAKENMFVNRGWRRRLQATVGPGHGRRRASTGTRPCTGLAGPTGIDGDSCRHETRPARRASTGTRVGTGLARHDGHRPGLGPHGTRLTPTGIPHDGLSDSSGTTGTPHDGLSDSSGTTGIPHNGRADSSGPCPAWAS